MLFYCAVLICRSPLHCTPLHSTPPHPTPPRQFVRIVRPPAFAVMGQTTKLVNHTNRRRADSQGLSMMAGCAYLYDRLLCTVMHVVYSEFGV
jgi:hypothetical protein